MLVALTPRQRFELLVSQFEPKVRQAFFEAIDDITDNVVLREIVDKIGDGDIEGAIRAMHLDAAAFQKLDAVLRDAFNASGQSTIETMPALRDQFGFQIVIRWNVRQPAAEQWLREHSSTLITNIVDETREVIRETFTEGLARGDNPTKTAVEVVGKKNRATGRREGGVIGLSAPQAKYVRNARRELEASDKASLQNYMTRERRDKRFDKIELRAIANGTKIPAATADKAVRNYSDKLLKLRGETIGLHETFAALGAAKDAAYQDQIDQGRVRAEHITKEWRHTPQENPRLQHIAMDGQKVLFNQPFVAPDGTQFKYPHAPGVPARHALGCKCFVNYKIDFVARLVT
jgi:hypothetical protein